MKLIEVHQELFKAFPKEDDTGKLNRYLKKEYPQLTLRDREMILVNWVYMDKKGRVPGMKGYKKR